jgi:hypothetical protein
MARLTMLEIGGLGFVRAVRPSPQKLRGDVCIIVEDTRSSVIWFWVGNSVRHDLRRIAQTRAEGISREGYRMGDEVVGGGSMPLVVVDQGQIDNPETAHSFSSLVALLEEPMDIRSINSPQGTFIFAELQPGAGRQAAVIRGKPSPAPGPPPIPAAREAARQPAAEPFIEPPTPKGTRFALEAALMAILRVHKEVHIEFKASGDVEELAIETVDGLRHTIKRHDGKMTFKWDPKTPKELKDLVALELKNLAK